MSLFQRIEALLNRRKQNQAFRQFKLQGDLIDFCSNDYLGFSRSKDLLKNIEYSSYTGATGSRLLSGHHQIHERLESFTKAFHKGESALIFNSGYDANIGIFSTLPGRKDLVLFDDLVHASIHDGMRLCKATCYSFLHNNEKDLALKLQNLSKDYDNIFVIIESIYSMDGDKAPLQSISQLCQQHHAHLIVDEAHATGVFGPRGEGLCVEEGIATNCFIRLHTFGKALGGHGAVVIAPQLIKDYLINFARPLIYTTALAPHSCQQALAAYKHLAEHATRLQTQLKERIDFFRKEINKYPQLQCIDSVSPIQGIIIPGNKAVSLLAQEVQNAGFDARPIRFPTVPQGKERIRICLHLHNSLEEIQTLIACIAQHQVAS